MKKLKGLKLIERTQMPEAEASLERHPILIYSEDANIPVRNTGWLNIMSQDAIGYN